MLPSLVHIKNESACRSFIIDIADYIFQEDIKRKSNWRILLSSCATGQQTKASEQVVINVIYENPGTNLSVINFFEITAPENS